MKMEYHPDFLLVRLFSIGITQESQHRAVNTCRWFDYIRNKALLSLFLKIVQASATMFSVLNQVEVTTISNTL